MSHHGHHEDPSAVAALFADRDAAERGAAAARDAAPGAAIEIDDIGDPRSGFVQGIADFFSPRTEDEADAGPYRVTASGTAPAELARAAAALEAAGGRRSAVGAEGAEPRDPADKPPLQRVQPGFADVRPGFVPKAADYPEDTPETEQTRGRFADQLDHLPPEGGGDERRRR